jgi:hypothetical protein
VWGPHSGLHRETIVKSKACSVTLSVGTPIISQRIAYRTPPGLIASGFVKIASNSAVWVGFQGVGLCVCGLVIGDWGLGVGIWRFVFRVQCFVFRVSVSGLRVEGLGCRV